MHLARWPDRQPSYSSQNAYSSGLAGSIPYQSALQSHDDHFGATDSMIERIRWRKTCAGQRAGMTPSEACTRQCNATGRSSIISITMLHCR